MIQRNSLLATSVFLNWNPSILTFKLVSCLGPKVCYRPSYCFLHIQSHVSKGFVWLLQMDWLTKKVNEVMSHLALYGWALHKAASYVLWFLAQILVILSHYFIASCLSASYIVLWILALTAMYTRIFHLENREKNNLKLKFILKCHFPSLCPVPYRIINIEYNSLF